MVVQHNLTAMNSNRMLGVTTSAQAKSTEKLSSGYKINRAADDAAGLAISEKMRKQIRGLTRASENAQDGISAVQTAEGALNEVQDMLQRMNELSVQAANGTNSTSDRSALQDEIDQLTTEIDRVSETTKFNETYLLKGNTDGTTSKQFVNAHDAGLKGTLTDKGNGISTFALDKELAAGDSVTIAGKSYTIGGGGSSATKYTTTSKIGTESVEVGDTIYDDDTGKTYTLVNDVANPASASAGNLYKTGAKISINGTAYTIAGDTSVKDNQLNAADAQAMVATALDKGQEVKMTNDGTNSVDYDIVKELGTNDVSVAALTAKTVAAFATAATVTLAADDVVTLSGTDNRIVANEKTIESTDIKNALSALSKNDKVTIGSHEYTVADETDASSLKFTVSDLASMIKDYDTVTFSSVADSDAKNLLTNKYGMTFSTNAGNAFTVVPDASNSGDSISKTEAYKMMATELEKASSIGAETAANVTNHGDGSFTINQGTVEVVDSLGFQLHVGADADMTNKITVDIKAMTAAGLGIKGLNILDDTGAAGTYAVDAIADALQKVSDQRAALGAVQNRLDHTIKNLDNVVENTTSAESQIRDTDMATEMVRYSNNNILAQAGQSMLAQANQSNQGVLSLLG